MPVNLKKGQKVSLTKDNPGLSQLMVGLGWDINKFDTGGSFDLDSAAFMLGDSGKVGSDADFIFVYEGCSCIAGEKKQVTANG